MKIQQGFAAQFVVQDPPLGTGHAVLKALPALGDFAGSVLIMYGDVPLIKEETLKKLIRVHQKQKAALSFATARLDHAPPYGRIFRNEQGEVLKIIEAKDILKEQSHINEFNVGLYLIEASFLKKTLKKLSSANKQHEYYLTDLVELAARAKQKIATLDINDELEWQGINNQLDLARVEKRILQDRCQHW
ncbi:MAG: Bifunctional protein glmU, partial [uncultured bacterium]